LAEEASIPHPDITTLVRYRDGGLDSRQRVALESHLGGCHTCRTDLGLLRAALTGAPKEAKSGMTQTILDRVRSKVCGWESRQSQELSQEAVRDRIAGQLGQFLGTRAARKVLEPVAPNNHNLFSIVEPVLSEFLGPGAAASLVDHVVESSIVKI
jgi:hypothetical protein